MQNTVIVPEMATTIIGVADFLEVWGDTVPDKVFTCKEDILKVVVPDWIAVIGERAFSSCSGLAILRFATARGW
jgi:hypothetical protein